MVGRTLALSTIIAIIALLIAFYIDFPPALSLSSSLPLSNLARIRLQQLRQILKSSSSSHNIVQRLFGDTTTTTTTNKMTIENVNGKKKTPVYFVSHGGPTTMYQTDHPVYSKLQGLGREITQTVQPDAIVVFSAHWQSDLAGGIEVNVSEEEPLLYDFYGFPKHYYQEKFASRGSEKVARRVLQLLDDAGIKARGVRRGLDHGAFVPFKVMFDSENNPVRVPIVQVSLFDDDSEAMAAALHLRLGQSVSKLREENILIIVSGMAVHNLRDFMMHMGSGKTMPYAITFDDALKEAVEQSPGEKRDNAMESLLLRTDARKAHPTFEHLLPIHIGVGAAGEDTGKQLWTMPEGSMSWAQYRFGTV